MPTPDAIPLPPVTIRITLVLTVLGSLLLTTESLAQSASSGPPSAWAELRNYTPLLAVFIPLVAYLTAQYKDWRSAQGTLNKAFQGDNDAVVYLTHKVQHNEWKRRMKRAPGFRREVLTALCLAWSVKPPDYIKAHLFDALLCVKKQGYGEETQLVLDKMLRQYEQYNVRFESSNFAGVIADMQRLKQELLVSNLP